MAILTDSDYEALQPHIEAIRKYRQIGGWVGSASHATVAHILTQRTGERFCLTCTGSIARMYELANIYLDQYEQHNKLQP